jgi:hypothetical protein
MLIEQAMEDLSAVMEPGLTALIDAHEAGAQTQPAAHALWQEFLRARHGLFALIPRRAMTRKAVASSLFVRKTGPWMRPSPIAQPDRRCRRRDARDHADVCPQ